MHEARLDPCLKYQFKKSGTQDSPSKPRRLEWLRILLVAIELLTLVAALSDLQGDDLTRHGAVS